VKNLMRSLRKLIALGMDSQTRLKRFEARTEWPLAIVAIFFLVVYSVQVLAHPSEP